MDFGSFPAPFTLPDLPYAYDALEPHIDLQTMQIHHDKHHQAYVTNLNKALDGIKDAPLDLDVLVKTVSKYPMAVRNNAGGHWNHIFFWNSMRATTSAGSSAVPNGKLADAINSAFISFDKFKEQFSGAGKDRFGSGWAWLILDKDKKLSICSTPNQDNPLMDIAETKGTPILAVDVWEHAYYLKYQNKRADYLAAWWNVVNWEMAAQLYENGMK
ncbi:MAG: superoxide dismutase [Bacteroidetes bacterium]|nr:superoxide dismutase [Bacteroidota bacterium]